jgi:hypothetical protein
MRCLPSLVSGIRMRCRSIFCSTARPAAGHDGVLCCVSQVVHVGERAVDHNPAFKLYLVTRNAASVLTPDVVPLLTVTNFSITRSGLESECRLHCLRHPPCNVKACMLTCPGKIVP